MQPANMCALVCFCVCVCVSVYFLSVYVCVCVCVCACLTKGTRAWRSAVTVVHRRQSVKCMLACNHHAEQAYQQQRADSADAPSHLNVQDIKRHRAEQEHALDTDVSFPEPSCAVGALPPHMFDNMGRLQVLLHTTNAFVRIFLAPNEDTASNSQGMPAISNACRISACVYGCGWVFLPLFECQIHNAIGCAGVEAKGGLFVSLQEYNRYVANTLQLGKDFVSTTYKVRIVRVCVCVCVCVAWTCFSATAWLWEYTNSCGTFAGSKTWNGGKGPKRTRVTQY